MRKPNYEDPSAVLYQGDALDVLGEMEPESVDLVVTSPPYFGLRRYPDTERVWGGAEGCEHIWGQEQIVKRGSPGNLSTMQGTQTANLSKVAGNQGSVCSLCGAVKCSFGNEPLADCGAWMRSVLTGEPIELCSTCYICHSILVLRAIWRVLRPWATCWWVIDDSLAGGKGQSAYGWSSQHLDRQTLQKAHHHDTGGPGVTRPTDLPQPGIKAQDRMGIPERLSLALQADGWHWRSTIIWAKAREIEQDGQWTGEGSTMPESVNGWRWQKHRVKVKPEAKEARTEAGVLSGFRAHTGYTITEKTEWIDCPACPQCTANGGYVLRKGNWRPTDSYERIIMLAKQLPYFGDAEAAAVPLTASSVARYELAASRSGTVRAELGFGSGGPRPNENSPRYKRGQGSVPGADHVDGLVVGGHSNGRNPRSVWEINPEPFPGGHFAVMPSAIPRKIITAMTSAKGKCPKCGRPWVPMVESKQGQLSEVYTGQALYDYEAGGAQNPSDTKRRILESQAMQSEVVDWRPSCRCGEPEPIPATVLDPFAGTGTTLAEAKKLGRRSLGIELVSSYCDLASSRLRGVTMPMEGLL